jgi:hypothetical protein
MTSLTVPDRTVSIPAAHQAFRGTLLAEPDLQGELERLVSQRVDRAAKRGGSS